MVLRYVVCRVGVMGSCRQAACHSSTSQLCPWSQLRVKLRSYCCRLPGQYITIIVCLTFLSLLIVEVQFSPRNRALGLFPFEPPQVMRERKPKERLDEPSGQ